MKVVIVGAGPAGVTAAETIRGQDRAADIVVLSREPYLPYSPPAMVDHFLTGSDLHFWRGEDWPARCGVEYLSGTEATGLDSEGHNLQLQTGSPLEYDRLLIASGSRLYAPVEGADLPGIYNFKSLSAAEALVKKVKGGKARSALIVGAGFIGMEIALLLRDLGVEVTQVEMLDQVMPAMLDRETAVYALNVMRERGIDVRLNTKAEAFTGEKKAQGVKLEEGETLKADLYIAATGVKPELGFLQDSGIKARWGIEVDDCLRTNLPDVYAAGDVIEARDRLTGETYVHAIFPNAVEQGRIAGLNMAGFDLAYEGAERMNSLKHLGLPIIAVGLKEGEQVLSTPLNGGLRKIFLQDDRIVGFQLVGDVHPAGALRTLMNRGENVKRLKDRLLDVNFGEGMLTWSAISTTVA